MNRFERTIERVIKVPLTDQQRKAALTLCEKMDTVPFIRSKELKAINKGDLTCLGLDETPPPKKQPAPPFKKKSQGGV